VHFANGVSVSGSSGFAMGVFSNLWIPLFFCVCVGGRGISCGPTFFYLTFFFQIFGFSI